MRLFNKLQIFRRQQFQQRDLPLRADHHDRIEADRNDDSEASDAGSESDQSSHDESDSDLDGFIVNSDEERASDQSEDEEDDDGVITIDEYADIEAECSDGSSDESEEEDGMLSGFVTESGSEGDEAQVDDLIRKRKRKFVDDEFEQSQLIEQRLQRREAEIEQREQMKAQNKRQRLELARQQKRKQRVLESDSEELIDEAPVPSTSSAPPKRTLNPSSSKTIAALF